MNWTDILTAVVAAIALVQPWIISCIRKKRSKILLLPSKTFEIGFNKRGVYAIMYGVLVSKNIDSAISKIKMNILKNNNSVYQLEWDLFLNPYDNWYSNGEQSVSLNSVTEAHQIYLNKEKPELLKIQYIDFDVEEKVKQSVQSQNRNDLIVQCKFEEGKYDVVFEVIDSENKNFKSNHYFDFSKENVKALQDNVDCILQNQKVKNQLTVKLQDN